MPVRFSDLKFETHPAGMGGIRAEMTFENGYTASVIKTPFSYGGNEGLFELAVMKNENLCYDTPITDDVLGYLTADQVDEILRAIQRLPKAE